MNVVDIRTLSKRHDNVASVFRVFRRKAIALIKFHEDTRDALDAFADVVETGIAMHESMQKNRDADPLGFAEPDEALFEAFQNAHSRLRALTP